MVFASVAAIVAVVGVASAAIVPGCTETDDRAMGAVGKARVDWKSKGCCNVDATLQSKSGSKDYGLYCTIGGNQSAADKKTAQLLRDAIEADEDENENDAPVKSATKANKDAKDSKASKGDEKDEVGPTDAENAVLDKANADADRANADADSKNTEADRANGVDVDAEASDEDDSKAAASKKKKKTSTKNKDADAVADASDEDSETEDDSACFPANATVELQSGESIPMSEVSVGDMVKVGVDEFSRVFMFTHKSSDSVNEFVSLTTTSGAKLSLTSGHYLFVNGALAAAKTVVVGDELRLGTGETTTVVSVASVEGAGLFNPQTVSGNVIVSGVLVSTYTTAVEPTFAHAILSPFRALQDLGFAFNFLESGGGVLADVAPRGVATV